MADLPVSFRTFAIAFAPASACFLEADDFFETSLILMGPCNHKQSVRNGSLDVRVLDQATADCLRTYSGTGGGGRVGKRPELLACGA